MDSRGEEKDGREIKPKLKSSRSFDSKDMFFRADEIDLKSFDIQLENKLNKGKGSVLQRPKEEWEIDLSKLELRYLVAQGTYGTLYRGTYDGQDVAGAYPTIFLRKFGLIRNLHSESSILISILA